MRVLKGILLSNLKLYLKDYIKKERIDILFLKLIVFLLPFQFGKHFWPSWAFIKGIRVDYLSPTIYLTDFFIFIFVILSFLSIYKNERDIIFQLLRRKFFLFIFIFSFIFLNILFSLELKIALLKWLRFFLFFLFGLSIYFFKGDLLKIIYKPFLFSVFLISVIGIVQFLYQSSIGGPFYFLGERKFNLFTVGIAKKEIFGVDLLRPYSTFSHPNSLAGFLGASFLFLIFVVQDKSFIKKMVLFFSFVVIILTFSEGVFISLFIVFIYAFFLHFLKKEQVLFSNLILFSILIFLSLFLISFPYQNFKFLEEYEEISLRFLLAKKAGSFLLLRPLFGVGFNNFILGVSNIAFLYGGVWFLQPVHNIFLLILSELGILGFLIFSLFIFFFFKKVSSKKNLSLVFLFILLTGFLDHYWLTLYQNNLLFFFFCSLALRS